MIIRFSDEQLTAYLDGEKNHTPYKEIDAALKTDKALQLRLKGLQINNEAILQSMDALLQTAPPAPLFEIETAKNDNSSWIKGSLLAACAAGFMLFSGIVGYSISDRQVDNWREYVAAYHYLYITNTLANVDAQEGQRQEEIARVGDAIGKSLTLDPLKTFAGLDYKRAQILGFEGKPLAQMTFLSKMGDPIALCVIRTGTHSQEAISLINMENMASASWAKDGYEYVIIGGKDKALIEDAAKHFASRI